MLGLLILLIGLFFCYQLFSQEEDTLQSVYFPEYPVREDVSDFAEQVAEFPSGAAEMVRYFGKNLYLPDYELESGFECIISKINIRFIVEQDGSITTIQFKNYNSNCPEFYEEVTKMLSSMPKWSPAVNEGVKIATYFYLPMYIKWS